MHRPRWLAVFRSTRSGFAVCVRGAVVATSFVVGVAGCADDAGSNAASEPGPRRLAVGPSFACALRLAGVYCWRYELGGDSAAPVPARVELAADDVVELAAGSGQACARRGTGDVVCWSMTGDGSGAASPVTSLAGARQLAVDAGSACALREDGSVACWGPALDLSGDGHAPVASPQPGLSDVVELRAGGGDSYCARSAGGAVQCLRLASGDGWSEPVAVAALTGATSLAMTSSDSVCGILPSSEILCVSPESGASALLARSGGSLQLRASGGLSACALVRADQWHCWSVLSLGAGASAPRTDVSSTQPLIDLGISGFVVCGVQEDSSVACASANSGTPQLRVLEGLPP